MAEKTKIVNIETVLAKKGLIETAPKPFYSDFFGGDIIVENTHAEEFAEMLTSGSDDELYLNSKLIYQNCPLFRSKELLKEYEIDDPYLLAKKVYGSNVVELLQLGAYILSIYGYQNNRVQNIKKK